MQILPINNLNNYNSAKNRKVMQNSASAKVQSMDTTSFQGSYKQEYLRALRAPIRDLWDCKALFRNLKNGVKSESLYVKSDYYINRDLPDLLQAARAIGSETVLARSYNYDSPLMTLEDGAIDFHHPDYGEFGNGNISFYLSGDNVVLNRDHYAVDDSGVETFEFWNSGKLKKYVKTLQGSVCEQRNYNEDGSPRRGLFDRLFGD